ncbi:AAA family ATPase [Polyangium sp. y55x31]|uniref:AAA family ATPase n=1 Tax=Polyangium sp. y55x31 TaxID=3042688 RepID=UPI0024829C88|nr:AAA family ATPase [Polyangium sp. y55x31]MDI1477759.1 AAA family ATPase [Polyangium sp. y55x31]
MRLKTLRLQNFRGFGDATLDLDRPLTVLFGANGSGKSSVLMALLFGFSELLHWTFLQAGGRAFSPSDGDIALGAERLTITMEFSGDDQEFPLSVRYRRGQGTEVSSRRSYDLGDLSFLPIAYLADRSVAPSRGTFQPIEPEKPLTHDWVLSDALDVGHVGFRPFFRWFKEREDAENRRKVQEKDLSVTDPQLSAVRAAVEGLLPGFSNLRIQHDPLRLEVTKGSQALSVDQLSDGEKQVLAITADIARRLAMVHADAPEPLQREAIVLVDEVELHLHPAWQRRVLPAWRRIFPGSQFIVTTHSPQVLSEVPSDAVFLVENFQFVRPGAPTEGRDSNAILEEVMSTPERPLAVKDELDEISRLIDEDQYTLAREKLDAVALRVTEQDSEVVRLRTLLHFLGDGDEARSQG